jgi:3-oxoacyl-[acyl-carrier-protein] synthase-3
MTPAGLFIAGVAAYIPRRVRIADAVRKGWYDASRAESEGWLGAAVADTESAPDMAVHAGRCALARSGLRPADIGILLHAEAYHAGPDLWYPHHYILRHTVARPIPTMGLRHSCPAMIQAMELAGCWLGQAGSASGALITGADRYGTPQFDRWNYANGWRSNRGSIMGDAGSAIVLSNRGGIAEVVAIRSASLPELEPLYRGDEPLFPPGVITGRPVRMGERVKAATARHPDLAANARRLLHDARTELALRTHVFTGRRRYLEDMLGPLGIDPDRGMLEFGRSVGHLGVNDHAAALDHLIETRAVRTGEHVLMIGNGVGVSLACAVVRISERSSARSAG